MVVVEPLGELEIYLGVNRGSTLGVNMGSDSIPPILSDESIYRGLICAHMYSIARTQKILSFMSLFRCSQYVFIHRFELTIPVDYEFNGNKKQVNQPVDQPTNQPTNRPANSLTHSLTHLLTHSLTFCFVSVRWLTCHFRVMYVIIDCLGE